MIPSPTDHTPVECAQASKFFPGNPHAMFVWRAMRKGMLARNGERVRLYHFRVGRKLFTTQAAIAEFNDALRKADLKHFESPEGARQLSRRERVAKGAREHTSAVEFLKSHGIAC